MFIETHECESEIGLPGVVLRIELDQRTADAPTHPRGGGRIKKGAPDHVTGNGEGVPVHMEGHIFREDPKDADKAPEQKRSLKKANAEVGRQFGQMASVLVDALVGIAAHLARIGQVKSAARFEPLVEKVEHQPFAQTDFRHLVEPGLSHVEDQKSTGNDAENYQLIEKTAQVFVRERIVKGLVPSVKLDLTEGGRSDDGDQGKAEQQDLVPLRRGPKGPGHHQHLRREALPSGRGGCRGQGHVGGLT